MGNSSEHVSMALFCDFENVALGVRDTKYQKFDIRPVLERLLLKGSIVVKKAYCDWERYKDFKAPMHEANFELIEIPHVRQSGKNSADIRLVVDALDFCYTKSHVNTFVIISGDSDFSPLVSKLRENNKTVIGVGVKQSTSDLLVANCDEFIFYDDLAREMQRASESRRDNRGSANSGQRRSPDEERVRKEELEHRKTQAVEMVAETFEALMGERGDSGKIWASVLKDALKRRRPDFNEAYYGFRAFGNLLEEAQSRGLLEVGRAENSSTYVTRNGSPSTEESGGDSAPVTAHGGRDNHSRQESRRGSGRRSGASGREGREARASERAPVDQFDGPVAIPAPIAEAASKATVEETADQRSESPDGSETPRKSSSRGRRRSRNDASGRSAVVDERSDALAGAPASDSVDSSDGVGAEDRVGTAPHGTPAPAPMEIPSTAAAPVPPTVSGSPRASAVLPPAASGSPGSAAPSLIPVAAPTVMGSIASTRNPEALSNESAAPAAPTKSPRARKRASASTKVARSAAQDSIPTTSSVPETEASEAPSAPAKRASKTARKTATRTRRKKDEGEESA
ncbi:NYN domain-containing protein [Bordetella sp. 02P26C-1]|uniref:NYN domain-containing protein n=1 Tax=Bordetella sp. 02P26C-1 TaxID=2683195 RepID=UPI0019239F9A|nr:NYN domain-containing protein [Bordetella sp. 02P26C-1]